MLLQPSSLFTPFIYLQCIYKELHLADSVVAFGTLWRCTKRPVGGFSSKDTFLLAHDLPQTSVCEWRIPSKHTHRV